MTGRRTIRGSSVGRRVGAVGLAGRFVLLCVLGIALVGCQKGDSTEKARVVQGKAHVVPVAQTQSGEPAGLDAESPLAKISADSDPNARPRSS